MFEDIRSNRSLVYHDQGFQFGTENSMASIAKMPADGHTQYPYATIYWYGITYMRKSYMVAWKKNAGRFQGHLIHFSFPLKITWLSKLKMTRSHIMNWRLRRRWMPAQRSRFFSIVVVVAYVQWFIPPPVTSGKEETCRWKKCWKSFVDEWKLIVVVVRHEVNPDPSYVAIAASGQPWAIWPSTVILDTKIFDFVVGVT